MTTTHHHDMTHQEQTSTSTTERPETILHLETERIDTTIELLEAAGLGPLLVCDGSCEGLSGCSIAPIGRDAIAA